MLESTEFSEIFTEVTVHQDKFFGLSNFEKISKLFRKFEIEISKIDNFGLAYLFAPSMLQVQTHAAVFYDPSALLPCRYLRWHFTFWCTVGHFQKPYFLRWILHVFGRKCSLSKHILSEKTLLWYKKVDCTTTMGQCLKTYLSWPNCILQKNNN